MPSSGASVTAEIKIAIIDHLSQGKTLADYLRDNPRPTRPQIAAACKEDPEFDKAYQAARDIGHDELAEGSLELVDETPERLSQSGGIDPAWVARQKMRVWHRMNLLAKWNPRKYGEKTQTELTGANGGPVVVSRIELVPLKP